MGGSWHSDFQKENSYSWVPMNEDSQRPVDAASRLFPFPSGRCHSTSESTREVNWDFPSLSGPIPSQSRLPLDPPFPGLASSATYIQPEGTAADTSGSSQRNPVPPNQIMFILQLLTSFLHSLHELIARTEFPSLLLLTKDNFPAEDGSRGGGKGRARREENPTLSHSRVFKVIVDPFLPYPFLQHMLTEYLPGGRNCVRRGM